MKKIFCRNQNYISITLTCFFQLAFYLLNLNLKSSPYFFNFMSSFASTFKDNIIIKSWSQDV